MKNKLPYILLFLIGGAFALLVITGNNKAARKIDNRITFRKNDKKPYGMFVAFNHLKYIFPKASISVNKFEPGYWDSLSSYETNQALIILADRFSANDSELDKLIAFAEHGNDVFITARELSFDAKNIFNCKTVNNDGFISDEVVDRSDSLLLSLTNPPFDQNFKYFYPGKSMSSKFSSIDTFITDIVGNDEFGNPNFIHLQAGKGHFYIHLAPIAFSNYFVLHKNNIRYFEKSFSLINPSVKKIVWDEYYLDNGSNNRKNDENGWLKELLKYPALKAALLTAILALLAYVLLEMRRKQRYIPKVTKPRNDSLDFVKTIGRLYYDKGNHQNLCKKMSSYFLEYVRNKYKLPTGTLDEEFISNLKFKSGAEESEVRGIVSFIKYVETSPAITPGQVSNFHKQLESFYKNA
ncbi:MAG: DUF4350 domain-containing protein [Chitinophagaceae bacterium]